ncbi:hypothetical protein [Thermodesulforhabdus norvegica]|uniref:Uroporphyrinogen decarboxylase (URO-D) domain-containing protein n=1 Tax=Thermodesulforhabdus norvegica TaxID=39841 RepID=A0A1I4SER1_9BACT|nr:hypothetical protein SAMN05660836_00924 [Thermodesulforhabdus norvegica]
MTIPGNFLTTAMAVMPHRDPDKALELALSLDIPFWPQLPLFSYYEDMYVQASEHFPGIILDLEHRKLSFSTSKFMDELPGILDRFEDPELFNVSPEYSVVYHKFLAMDLADRPAIRGQIEGPISFGFNVQDEKGRPILFNDEVRSFLLEFMARRVNVQLRRLKEKNKNAFMFIDEPGLQFVFSGMSGYDSVRARFDLEYFFSLIERPRGIHLCGNPDWEFLLGLDLDILSLDVYTNGEIFSAYGKSIRRFLERGGVLSWGMVPTNFEPFEKESLNSLFERFLELFDRVMVSMGPGIDREMLISRSLLSPATCCLVNPDGAATVEKAFGVVKELSGRLREHFGVT